MTRSVKRKAEKRAAFERNNRVTGPAIEFAPAESWEKLLAEKPKSQERLYAEKHGQWIDED